MLLTSEFAEAMPPDAEALPLHVEVKPQRVKVMLLAFLDEIGNYFRGQPP